MRLKAMAAATLAAASLVLGIAGPSTAATHPAPAGHAATKAPKGAPTAILPGHWTTEAPRLPQGCGWLYIGSPGNYGTPDGYAGQVEQMYNSCNGDVYAHWQWDSGFMARFPDRQLNLAVGSPYYNGGQAFWTGDVPASNGQDEWFEFSDGSSVPHGWANPDAWRVGAELDDSTCVAWGTLHWYGGQDWSGPVGGCGDKITPS
ncbi:hypothetical protein GCM10009760_54280 [Kitasatospora kazusensis]|uniref:Uncharacterized protein n=1 Tax=Kitasatospora kazusensis TaxID=407974 RepID=A0ABN3A752_9ACTN